jgi:nucleoside-diphosphate-sugar epimerase
MKNMNKIGITGGGYIGSLIIENLLKEGYKVRCIDNAHKGNCDHLFTLINDYPNFEFQRGDINHPEDVKEFVKGLDFIFNTAAIVGFPACKKHQVLAKATHIDAVKDLIRQKDINCGLIQFSTDSCYGINKDFCTEDTPLNPQSLYGETKALGEQIVKRDPNSIILRLSTGCGLSHVMRNNLLVNDLVYQAVTTKELKIFQPDASRSFINVKDISRAAIHFMKLLLNKENKYSLYNIGDDSMNYTKRELVDLISSKTGCSVEYVEGSDPDCRDYKISHQRQYDAGFKAEITMEETIDTLIRAVPLIEWQMKYQ